MALMALVFADFFTTKDAKDSTKGVKEFYLCSLHLRISAFKTSAPGQTHL